MIVHFRFRTQTFTGKVVLQVLDKVGDGPPDSNGMPEWLAGEYWRDARMEDMGEVHALIGKPFTWGNA